MKTIELRGVSKSFRGSEGPWLLFRMSPPPFCQVTSPLLLRSVVVERRRYCPGIQRILTPSREEWHNE